MVDDGAAGHEEHAVAHALRGALPTIRHAEMLFDMVVHSLGESGLVHTSSVGTTRFVFRRKAAGSDRLVPWPLLTLSFEPQRILEGFTLGLEPVDVPERDEAPPNLRGLKPGHVIVHDGPCSMQVTYREDGLWKETSRRGPSAGLSALRASIERGGASAPERVADFVLANDIARHGPGELHYPTPLPSGPAGAWGCGLSALRRALHERSLPSTAGWLIADGFDGSARVHGASEADTLSAWQQAIAERTPCPPMPSTDPAVPDDEPWAAQDASVPGEKPPPWPEAIPRNTPAALVRLEACPLADHPWGTWMRALGPHGESVFALQRFRPDGFTLIGQDVLDLVDLETLEVTLDAAEAKIPEVERDESEAWKGEPRTYPCLTVTYRVVHERTGEPVPLSYASAQRTDAFGPEHLLDGSRLRGSVFRQRWG